MLSEKYLERYADVLVWGLKTARTGRYKKGDIILIRYDRPAVRLAEIIYDRVVGMDMHPVQRMVGTPAMEKSFFGKANNKQLVFQAPGEAELYGNIHGSIFLNAPESITHLSDIDPTRIGKAAIARKPLRDILDKREEAGDFGWTLCMLPTAELAQHAGLDEKEYARQIARACFLDKTDPVAAWQEVYRNAAAIKKWLSSLDIEECHVESENIDLVVTPGLRRRWLGISGHNIPSFEIFLSPDWRGTRGIYYADQPSYRSGNYVEGVRLEFARGKVVDVQAVKGADFVKKQLGMDQGASRLGEFSLTDKRFSKISKFMANTLFDENFGGAQGNCHVALGASYSDTYDGDPAQLSAGLKKELGFNDSALHWDLVNTEKKRVKARLRGGKVVTIYENGKFTF